MSTYDNKPLSFDSLKQAANREPTLGTTKEVVEKLYSAHRERVLTQHTVLDTHVHIPEFMRNQVWRKMARDRQDKILAVDNEHFYKRLLKAENRMSIYTAETIEHNQLIEGMSKHMNRLKEQARLRKNVQIQRENEYMIVRLNKAKPKTSADDIKNWYQYHVQFKEGRRTDPTAGHIMKSIHQRLLPAPLPPLSVTSSVLDRGSRASDMDLDSTFDRSLDGGSSNASLAGGSMESIGSASASVNQKGSRRPITSSIVAASVTSTSSASRMSRGSTCSRAGTATDHTQKKKMSKRYPGGAMYGMGDAETLDSLLTTVKQKIAFAAATAAGNADDTDTHTSDDSSWKHGNASILTRQSSESSHKKSLSSRNLAAKVAGADYLKSHPSLNIADDKILLAERVVKLPVEVDDEMLDEESGDEAEAEVSQKEVFVTPAPAPATAPLSAESRRTTFAAPDYGPSMARTAVAAEWAVFGASDKSFDASMPQSTKDAFHAQTQAHAHQGQAPTPEQSQTCRILALHEPGDTTSITLRVMVDAPCKGTDDDSYDDDFEDAGPAVIGERVLSAAAAKEIVSANLDLMDIVRNFTTDSDRSMDVLALRSVILKVFRQADDYHTGQLVPEQFKNALMKFDSSLTAVIQKLGMKELSMVMSEAEGEGASEDGTIDLEEYIVFVAELLLALRARDQGRMLTSKVDAAIDQNIRSIMQKQDLTKIVTACQKQFYNADTQKSGWLKLTDIRPILFSMGSVGLTDVEVVRCIREMPRDSQGLVTYSNFRAILEEVRFNTLKQAMVELRGTKLQRALLDDCKVAEEKYEDPKSSGMPKSSQFVASGFSHIKYLLEVFSTSSHVTLTKMQAMVLVSEATIAADGKVDYYKLIPALANAVEVLAERDNGPQRDILVETSHPDFDVATITQSFTKRQLKDIAKKILNLVKLRLSASKGLLGDHVDISLPRDDLVLLAARPMEHAKSSLNQSQSRTKADTDTGEEEAAAVEDKSGSVLEIMHSSYTPSGVIMRIVDEADNGRVIFERFVSISQARSELYKLSGNISEHLSGIKKLLAVTDDPEALLDLGQMKTLLINMFHEVDDDDNGYLTFDEFQELLHQMDLGVPHNEMRMLINESDENQDGVIQFKEFVPLAVDMIMTFTARRRALAMTMEQDSIAEFSVYSQMQGQDIERTVAMCMGQFEARAGTATTLRTSQKDSAGTAQVIKQSKFKQILFDVSNELGGAISPVEMSRLLHMMPHNSFAQLIYTDFPTAFEKTRFSLLKHRYYESQGGLLTAFLSDCALLEEEQHELQRPRHNSKHDPALTARHQAFVPTGFLDYADIKKMLLQSSTVSLGKLQVMVIVSCFDLTTDGKVDYVKYAPLVVNIIRMLNNPAALRQKAELIESQDLSIASLIADLESGANFDQKLKTLFHTYDTNRNDLIDRKEFLVCLQSLGFGKTAAELRQVAELAKEYDGFEIETDLITFDGFRRFFHLHLLNLSKQTEVREMRNRLKSVVSTMTLMEKKHFTDGQFDIGDYVLEDEEETVLVEHLASLFRMMDKDENPKPGFINHDEVEEVGVRGCLRVFDGV